MMKRDQVGMGRDLRTGGASILLGALLLLGGCREIGITTRISADGSLERIEELRQDKDDSGPTAWLLPSGPGWEQSPTSIDSSGERTTTWNRRFARVEELAADLDARPASEIALRSRVSLIRRDRLFSTLYEWKEILPTTLPFQDEPLAEWFSGEEIALLQSGEADSTLSSRADDWQARNIFGHFHRLLVEEARRLSSGEPSPARIEAEKEHFFSYLMEHKDDIDLEHLGTELLRLSRSVLGPGTDRLSSAAAAFDRDFAPFNDFTDRAGGESLTFTVVMPGQILDTNARDVVGSSASWKDTAGGTIYADVVMSVQSRVTRTGRVVAALLLVVLLVGSTVVLLLRRPI
jgi:hypothetical protein